MNERSSNDYPVSYERTLERAKRDSAMGIAIKEIDEIEERWVRVTTCEGYSLRDLRKDVLLTDITILLKCCVTFINKVAELDALAHHRRPAKLLRAAKRIALPLED